MAKRKDAIMDVVSAVALVGVSAIGGYLIYKFLTQRQCDPSTFNEVLCPDGIHVKTECDPATFKVVDHDCPVVTCRDTHPAPECISNLTWDCVNNVWVNTNVPCNVATCRETHPTAECIANSLWDCVGEEWSNTNEPCGGSDVPSAPQNFKAEVGTGKVTLSWTPPADTGGSPLAYFRIYRNTSPTAYPSIHGTWAWGLTHIDLDLVSGNTYYYRIAAINQAGAVGAAVDWVVGDMAGPITVTP